MNHSPGLPPVIELRQYTLHPGRRDDLITLFESELIAPQQACGVQLLGQFHDLDDVDRFVWLRGFASMPARARALADFYDGPVWQAHRNATNATMIDSANVLLLRPSVLVPPPQQQANRDPTGRVVATICPLRELATEPLRRCVAEQVLPHLQAQGAQVLACLETEPAANTFERLPVREGEPVLVWLASLPHRLTSHRIDTDALLDRWLLKPTRALQLQATPQSAWR